MTNYNDLSTRNKMNFHFLKESDLTEALEEQVKNLFSELSDTPTLSLRTILHKNEPPYIVVCSVENSIVGMATLVVYDAISGRKAWIEDVVVSSKHRQKGIGERLTNILIEKANELNVSTLLLYSNPKREAAHRLYKRLGFTEKGSTLFALSLKK